jgi:heme oxygenase
MKDFSYELRNKTKSLHEVAERIGFNLELFNGNVSKELYLKYLLQKYETYVLLEQLFKHNKELTDFLFKELNMSEKIKKDIFQIKKDTSLSSKLDSVDSYRNYLIRLSEENPLLLLAHSYTLYFADLSGGQIIKNLLIEKYDYPLDILNTYEFKEIENISEFKKSYIEKIESIITKNNLEERFIEESKLSYIFSISILVELVKE